MDNRDAGLSPGESAGSQASATKGMTSKPSSAPMESSIKKSASVGIRCNIHSATRDVASATPSAKTTTTSGASGPLRAGGMNAGTVDIETMSVAADVGSGKGGAASSASVPASAPRAESKDSATTTLAVSVVNTVSHGANDDHRFVAACDASIAKMAARADPEKAISTNAGSKTAVGVKANQAGAPTPTETASNVSSVAAVSALTDSEAVIASNSGPRESITPEGDKVRSPTRAVSGTAASAGASFKVKDFPRAAEGDAPTKTGSRAYSRVSSDDSTDSDMAIPSGASSEVAVVSKPALASTSTVTESQAASEASGIALADRNPAIAGLIDSEVAILSGASSEVVVATKAALASTSTVTESQAASKASGATLADPNPAIASNISSKKVDAPTGAGTKTSAGENASNAAEAGASAKKTGFGTVYEPAAAAGSELATSSSNSCIASVGSEEVKAGGVPASGSSSGGNGTVNAVTSSTKSSTVVLKTSITSSLSKDKRHGKQQVQEAASVSAADVVDALSSALSTPRVKQAPVVTARGTQPTAIRGEAVSGKGIVEGGRSSSGRGTGWTHAAGTGTGLLRTVGIETDDLDAAVEEVSGSLFADIKGALIFDQKELAFRQRINRELIHMLLQNGGSCPMSSVAKVYQRTFKRIFHLGGRKLRNLLENDGGLKRITLDEENGGVVRLEAPSSKSVSMGKLTRTIVNKKALKHGSQPSLKDSSMGPTSEMTEPEAAELTNKDNLDLCDSRRLDDASLKHSVKTSTMTYANSGGSKEHESVRSGREKVYKPPSLKLSRDAGYADRDRDYSKKEAKKAPKKPNRGRSRDWSRSRSRSLRARHLRGNFSTKRNRSREASYSPARDRGDERAANKRGGRLSRLPSIRSRSRSEDRGRGRRAKRGQASHVSHGRSPESRGLGRNRDRNPESRSFGKNRDRNSESRSLGRNRDRNSESRSLGRNRDRNSESRSFDRNQDRRLRSVDVSRDEQLEKLRNRHDADRGSSFVVMRVAREEEASGKERMSEPKHSAHHRAVLAQRSSSPSAAAPALDPSHRDHLPKNDSAKSKYDRNPHYGRHEQYGSDGNGGSYHHESSAGNEDGLSHRGGARVEAGARPSKRRLVDGLTESAYLGAQGMRAANDQAGAVSAESRNVASIDRGPKQYVATTRSGDVERDLMDKGAGFRGEMTRKPVIPTNELAVRGMHSDIPALAKLPPPGTIQPLPLSVDRPQGSRLMVKGTHPAVPERRIHALASAFGTVGKIEVLEGFVFVHMKYLEEAQQAVAGLSGELLPHISAGPNIPLTAEVWSEEMYQALMTRENMRTYADSMRKASTWYEKHKSTVFDGRTGASMTCRFFALGRGCVFGHNCVFIHERPHGLMGNYLGSGAVASRTSLDLPAVPPTLPPRGHPVAPRARMDPGHFNVRQMIPADGNHEGRPRPMFVQNGEQYSRPSTGPRRGQIPENDFKDNGDGRDAWQSEHRPPNQGVPRRNHAIAMRGDTEGMEARTHVDPFGVENAANYPGKETTSRQDHGYGHVNDVRHDLMTDRPKANRVSAGGIESTGHLSQRFDNRSPQRGPRTNETNRDGVGRRRSDVDAIAEISFDSRGRATRGHELRESRSSSKERHRSRGHDTRRHSYDRRDDRVRLHDDASRRDNDISRHNRDVSRRDRDISRPGRFSERRDRSDDRRIRNSDRLRDRDDGKLDRNTFGNSSSRSDNRRAHHRGDISPRRDDVKRESYDFDRDEQQAFPGRERRGRGVSDLRRDRSDHQNRNGERGRHHEHPRSINTRQKRARSYDGDSDHEDNEAVRQVKRSVERKDRGGREKRRKDDVASLRRRPDVGIDHHEDEIPPRRPSRDDRATVDGIDNQEERGQQFLDWDDELMGDGSGETGNGRPVGTTFTVTARMGTQPTQRDVVPPAGTTFSVTMPQNLTGVFQSRALQGVEQQGSRQGRGGGRGGRGMARGRGGRFALN